MLWLLTFLCVNFLVFSLSRQSLPNLIRNFSNLSKSRDREWKRKLKTSVFCGEFTSHISTKFNRTPASTTFVVTTTASATTSNDPNLLSSPPRKPNQPFSGIQAVITTRKRSLLYFRTTRSRACLHFTCDTTKFLAPALHNLTLHTPI